MAAVKQGFEFQHLINVSRAIHTHSLALGKQQPENQFSYMTISGIAWAT